MAVYQSIALGKAKGSIGGVTFTVQRGQTIAKSKPISVGNPNTTAQQTQRSRFSDASNFAKNISNFLQRYHKPTSNRYSPRNSFMNSMLKLGGSNVFTPANTAPLPILYANGPLSLPAFTHDVAPLYNGTNDQLSLEITWPTTLIGQDATDDQLYLFLINVTTGTVATIGTGEERGTGAWQGIVPNVNGTDAYTVVAMFLSDDQTLNSIGYPIASCIAGTPAGYAGGNNSNMPF